MAEKRKNDKYDPLLANCHTSFIPLACDFYGTWGKSATNFFTQTLKQGAARLDMPFSAYSLQFYRQLETCLIRHNALAVLERLPLDELSFDMDPRQIVSARECSRVFNSVSPTTSPGMLF